MIYVTKSLSLCSGLTVVKVKENLTLQINISNRKKSKPWQKKCIWESIYIYTHTHTT